jgi:glycosyltransferase involved in cell wall biosynthesis
MKIVFVYWGFENAGSMLDLRGYTRAAKALGHEVTIYGPPNAAFALEYSQELEGADAIVFIFEWTTQLQFGDRLDWARLIQAVPRNRRVVIDCDGAYNEKFEFRGDYNHKTEELSRKWIEVCDSISDKICQPTLRPKRPNVRPFLFHIYDPTWESKLDFSSKEFSMIYVGHTKFRWHGMSQVLQAIEPVRSKVGRVGLVGEGWDAPQEWTEFKEIKADYFVDRDWLRKNKFEALPAIPFAQVTETMNKGVFNPVIYRPLFEYLDFVTCRTFETPAAGTIPLFLLDQRYVAETFGDRALELAFGEGKRSEKILDVLARPEHYAGIVQGIRTEFAVKHSPEARLKRLIEIIEE